MKVPKFIKNFFGCIKKYTKEKDWFFNFENIREGYKVCIGDFVLYTGAYDDYHKSVRVFRSFKRRFLEEAKNTGDADVYWIVFKCQ